MEALQLIAQIHKTEKRTDGSIRLTLDCGLESFETVQHMELMGLKKGKVFAIAVVAYDEEKHSFVKESNPSL